MSEQRIKLGERIKGPMMENEDWWHLVVRTDGTKNVEHEWSHVDPYGKKPSNSGIANVSVEEFLAGDASEGLKAALKTALKEFGA